MLVPDHNFLSKNYPFLSFLHFDLSAFETCLITKKKLSFLPCKGVIKGSLSCYLCTNLCSGLLEKMFSFGSIEFPYCNDRRSIRPDP